MTTQRIKRKFLARAMALVACGGLIMAGLTLTALPLHAAPEGAAVEQAASAQNSGMKYLAAALAVGLGSIGAGFAVAMVGSAAMGAVVERPELLGRALLYVGLAEGLGIYGLVIAFVILKFS